MSGDLLATVLVGLIGVGVYATYYGWRRRQRFAVLRNATETDVQSLSEPGQVALSGTVEAIEGATVDAPLTDEVAQVAAWSVREWSESGDAEYWRPEAKGVVATAFQVNDGSTSVRVELDDHTKSATLSGAMRETGKFDGEVRVDDVTVVTDDLHTVYEVGVDEEPPDAVARLVTDSPEASEQEGSITNLVDVGNAHGDRKYKQGTVSVGDEVLVVGHARLDEDGADSATDAHLRPETTVVTPPLDSADTDAFVLSTRSKADLLGGSRVANATYYGGPLLVVAVVVTIVVLTQLGY